jgi:Bardet-Biedl syndrome 1 protein
VTSAELLALDKAPVSNLSLYIEEHRAEARELRRLSVVTCMTAIPRDSHEPRAQSQLVVGTEAGDVLVLSAAGTSVEARFALPGGAQPASINSTGLWSVDSRLVVRTREGTIRAIRNQRMTSTILRTGVPITCCVAMESAIVAATMDGRLHCWHPKGKALWNDDPPSAVVSMCKVADPHASREVVAVALADGDVRLYAGGVVLHSTGATNVEGSTDPDSGSGVTAMVFGGFGGERRCLITAHAMGSVRVRVLPRRARLESAAVDSSSPPDEQDVPMDLPKRTRLHVQNIHREQAEAPEIWRSLERDRRRLRLAVMREYVKTISSGVAPDATGTIVSVSSLFDVAPAASASSSSSASAGSSSGSAASPLRLTAEVQGVGPGFLIVLHLTSAMRITAAGAWLVVSCDEAQYTVEGSLGGSHLIVLPPLPPKMPVVVPVAVRCIDPAGAPRGQIRLTVVPPHDRLGEPGGLTAAAAAVAQGGSSAPAELVAAFSRPIASLAVDMPQSVEAEM